MASSVEVAKLREAEALLIGAAKYQKLLGLRAEIKALLLSERIEHFLNHMNDLETCVTTADVMKFMQEAASIFKGAPTHDIASAHYHTHVPGASNDSFESEAKKLLAGENIVKLMVDYEKELRNR